jgi:hypothetical protein
MLNSGSRQDRIENVNNYKLICTDFIKDLSTDYIGWIERYDLEEKENKKRKEGIKEIVEKSNNWIYVFGNSIKKIDIIMNDGINKMAETTAGYPFKFDIYIKNMFRYTYHEIGKINVNLKAIPRLENQIRLGKYDDINSLLINSSSTVNYTISKNSFELVDVLDDFIVIDATKCSDKDVISFTTIVEECKNDFVSEKRGYSTIISINQKS